MLQLYCATLTIFIKNKQEENEKLSNFFYFIKRVFNEERTFPPHTLETNNWLNEVKWRDSKIYDCDNCVTTKAAIGYIIISDEDIEMEFSIEISENHFIEILISNGDIQFEDNSCLKWQEEFITLLVKEKIVDVGVLFADSYGSIYKRYKSTLFIGKINLILSKYFLENAYLYEKRNKEIVEFMQNNWYELHKKDEVTQIMEEEVKRLYKEAKFNSFFTDYPPERPFQEMIYESYIKGIQKLKNLSLLDLYILLLVILFLLFIFLK